MSNTINVNETKKQKKSPSFYTFWGLILIFILSIIFGTYKVTSDNQNQSQKNEISNLKNEILAEKYKASIIEDTLKAEITKMKGAIEATKKTTQVETYNNFKKSIEVQLNGLDPSKK